jgi:radical SAM superfamily enzyme YgiQ (UPF0313 family)
VKVLLIHPTHRPLSRPMLLAAYTPSEVEVRILDAYVERLNLEAVLRRPGRPDLVGIGTLTPQATHAYHIADEFRRRGVPVVLGGIHPTALPQEALEHADSVVLGEGEQVWPRLLADFQAGRLQARYQAERHVDLGGLRRPRRELAPTWRYWVKWPVETSRGCPFNCMYCSDSTVFGFRYRFRPVEEVVAEVRSLGRPGYVFFVDNNIVGDIDRAKELFAALIPLGIRWTAQASISMSDDEELLRLARRSGCIGVLIGLETLKKGVLRKIGKPVDPAKYREQIARIRRQGILVQGEFIFGFDEDDASVFAETVSFAEEAELDSARFAILKPYPGTRLFRTWMKEGRITTTDWSLYHTSNVVYRPAQLTPAELAQGRDWAYNRFGSPASIWRRVGLSRRYAPLVWALNFGNRAFKNSLRPGGRKRAAGEARPRPRRTPRASEL